MPKARFFTWYRVAPLAVVFVFGLISLVYSCAPAAFFKPLYPIDYEAYVKQSSISHNLDPEGSIRSTILTIRLRISSLAAHTSRIFSPISTGRRIVPSPPITPVWAMSTDGRSRTRHSIMRLPSLKLRLI